MSKKEMEAAVGEEAGEDLKMAAGILTAYLQSRFEVTLRKAKNFVEMTWNMENEEGEKWRLSVALVKPGGKAPTEILGDLKVGAVREWTDD